MDSVFTLFTDDFTYVHPNYGGVYTREDLYNGYKRNLKDGVMYDLLLKKYPDSERLLAKKRNATRKLIEKK